LERRLFYLKPKHNNQNEGEAGIRTNGGE